MEASRNVPPLAARSSDQTAEAGAQWGEDNCAPAEAGSLQARRTREAMARLWADPDFRARQSAQMKARWADPAYWERAGDFHRDKRSYRWQHIESGRIVSRTRREMHEEFGLRADSLDLLVAGGIKPSRGWRLAPRSLLGEAPRWAFP